jgi:AcrR family transcriptional regulator
MPRSSREKSEETRVKIVEAAYRLFLERGYSGASMRDLSVRTGVTVGAIYNHFPTKEDLWLEVILVKHPYHEILPVIQAAEGTTVDEMVRSAANALVEGLLKRPDLFNLLFIEIVEFNGKHVQNIFDAIFPQVMQLATKLNEKEGKVRDIPQIAILRSFLGMFFSYYVTGILIKSMGIIPIDAVSLNQFVDIYLYGLLAEDDPSRLALANHPLPPTK